MFRLQHALLFFCLILILITLLSEAKERQGADVLIHKIDGTEVIGQINANKYNYHSIVVLLPVKYLKEKGK